MLATINLFTPLWLMWGAIFLAIEGTAIWARLTKRIPDGGTLSSLVWRFIGPGHTIRRILFGTAWLVLTSHFFFQIP